MSKSKGGIIVFFALVGGGCLGLLTPPPYTQRAVIAGALIAGAIATAYRYTLGDKRNSKIMFAYNFLRRSCVFLVILLIAFTGISLGTFFKGKHTEAAVFAILTAASAILFLLFFYTLRRLTDWSAKSRTAAGIGYRSTSDSTTARHVNLAKCTTASGPFVDLLTRAYTDMHGVHAETVIGAAAALAGHYALLAKTPSPLASQPRWIVNTDVDELLINGRDADGVSISDIIRQIALKLGVARTALPDVKDLNARIVGKLGSSPFPPISVSKNHWPREWSPNATVRFRDSVDELARKNGLNTLELAYTLTIATATLIELTRNAIPPTIATTLALEIIFGVSKMGSFSKEF